MVTAATASCLPGHSLSVLALSSRFDGRRCCLIARADALSVLALSSRFDGLDVYAPIESEMIHFQYSLCRVVLMVHCFRFRRLQAAVLSVLALSSRFDGPALSGTRPLLLLLSVLALSSRFDGPHQQDSHWRKRCSFSTRSVESF